MVNKSYSSVFELLREPLKFEDEVELRKSIYNDFSTSPICIVDNMQVGDSIELNINAIYFADTKEEIEIIS